MRFNAKFHVLSYPLLSVCFSAVGYGDTYPTTFGGKCVAAAAMLMGVLVIAFPVSVFSDLWSKELKKQGVLNEVESQELSPSIENEKDVMSHPTNSGHVLISEADLSSIKMQMRQIDEAQNEIRRILESYSDSDRPAR
jgi:hypothetical protein